MTALYTVLLILLIAFWVGLFFVLVDVGWRLDRYWRGGLFVDVHNPTTARLIREAEFTEAQNRQSAVVR